MVEQITRTRPTEEGVSEPMSFDDFKEILAEVLEVGEEKVTREASFITDLAVDSITMVELVLKLQSLGIEVPPESIWEIQTVGDVYEYYVNRVLA